MTAIFDHFYKNRVALNVLAKGIDNARDVYRVAEKKVLIGVLSKKYPTVQHAADAMIEHGRALDDAVSIGLGSGDSKQGKMVAEITKTYAGKHINQVFPLVGQTRANLGKQNSWINALVTPTGLKGYVNIATGPFSEKGEKAVIPVKTAIALVRDMGGNALKYFPMNGLSSKAEYQAVATACGDEQFGLEPTGGIDKENFTEIVEIALAANVPQVIPHVYSSIIDPDTGNTSLDDIDFLINEMKRLVDNYE
ncbi:KDGP aldolase [Gracilibacillus caseinilyticus]|uniref:KDGP aldolase n=1 Tax=Gracilibacillus caseinilyticus TaxID=2932256 RepID=A0ABY4ESU1_9BACI|nr:KDGP aldolase [Gracilibacillus caseinilyticus]UOQ46724.1 KDGP aldolase [Gracilibacillus caseinilyticus]